MRKEQLETVNWFGLYLWLSLAGVGLSLYFLRPEIFQPQLIRDFFAAHLQGGLLAYFLISTLRGFTLIPSTPIVLAGILLFPPLPLWLVNQAAVYTSSAIVYYMARYVRFDNFFHSRYPAQTRRLSLLLHRRELPVIAVWGFLPVVPSDMIVYVCSVLRISVWKTLFGISIGEGVICAIYIFGGALTLDAVLQYLQTL